jgi:hypothetical protein
LTGPYRTVELDAGHFLAQDAPATVVEEICAHIQENPL